jgi:multiple sugar transport system substrate-binding protein
MVHQHFAATAGTSRRRFLAGAGALFGGAAALPLLSACGSSSSGSGSGSADSGDVLFWSQLAGSKKTAGDAVVAAFQSAYPKVHLTTNLYGDPDQLNQKLLTSFAGGTVPDVFVHHWLYSVRYAATGNLLDLGPLMSENGPKTGDVDANLLRFGQVNGKVYALPMYGTSRALNLNNKMLTKAGLDATKPPTTWDGLRQWAKALTVRQNGELKVAGLQIVSSGLAGWEIFLLLLQGAGGSLLSDDNATVKFNGDAGVQALSFLVDLVTKDKVCDPGFGTGAQAQQDAFLTGRAAMSVGGNYSLNAASAAGVDLALAAWPTQPGGATTIVDPFCFSIPAHAKNRAAAYTLIQFAMQQAQQVAFGKTSRNLPALTAAQSATDLTADKQLAFFVGLTKYAPANPAVVSSYPQMQTIVAKAVDTAVYGRQSPKAALDDAASQVKPLLASK